MSISGGYLPDQNQSSGLGSGPLADFAAATSLEPQQQQRVRRLHARAPVESCRPIGVQLLNDDGGPACAWVLADILDISNGGFCLLITEHPELAITTLMRLRLDVRPHPSFGVDLLHGELRWFVNSGFVLSFGVGLDAPLAAIPPLLPCRRASRRELDPAEQLLG
jgi:hypothetical protein